MKMHRTEIMRIPAILQNEIVMVVFRQSSFSNQGVVDCTAVFRLCKRYTERAISWNIVLPFGGAGNPGSLQVGICLVIVSFYKRLGHPILECIFALH